jgi:UDP-2,3-diacylglucosamine pyrophosphatase LpxH
VTVSFDLLSDLYLEPNDSFNWESKATSLFCLVSGNISNDLRTIEQTLRHLARFYHAIFYTPGFLEYERIEDMYQRTAEIAALCNDIKGVTMLHHHVIIVDGIAVVGSNGWYGLNDRFTPLEQAQNEIYRYEDLAYLQATIEKLQMHLDVKKIIIVSSSVPKLQLYFGEHPKTAENETSLDAILSSDTQKKVAAWAFGTYEKVVDTKIDGIHYVNNPYLKKLPYWAKRISINF